MKHPAHAPIGADCRCEGFVLLIACLAEFLADLQHPLCGRRRKTHIQKLFHGCLAQILDFLAGFLLQPFRKLRDAVRVLQSGQLPRLREIVCLDRLIELQRTVYKFYVNRYATRGNRQVGLPLLLHKIRNDERAEPALDLHFRHNVLRVVLLEKLPFFRFVRREVARALPVGFRRFAGLAEIPDKPRADGELLLVLREPQRLTGCAQTRRIATVEAVKHRVAPLVKPARRILNPKEPAQAVPLKSGIVGVLERVRAHAMLDDLRGDLLPPCQINHARRRTVEAVAEEQHFERRALRIAVQPRLADLYVGICLNVDRQMVQPSMPYSPMIGIPFG